MAEDQQDQDRSEAPSQFKLAQARRKGAVAKGVDLGFFASLTAFTLFMWLRGTSIRDALSTDVVSILVSAGSIQDNTPALTTLVGTSLAQVVRPLAFLAATVFLAVLLLELIQTGFVFTTETLRFDFGKLSPGQNLKRTFSKRVFVDTAKNVVKLTAYTAIAALVIISVQATMPLAVSDAAGLSRALFSSSLRLLLWFVGLAAGFAVLDQFIVRRDFLQRMRMSRRELRREHRDREGDPRLKQRRKQLHNEFTKISKSLRNIRSADLMITNPTHYAVGLRYRPGMMDAPVVVCRGANRLALRLKRTALMYGVAVVEDKALAQLLFHRCQLDQQVPDLAFQRIADHYLALRRGRTLQMKDDAHA